MILINEFLPNPAGSDSVGEWVELYNSGNNDVVLAGWRLENQKSQKFFFKNEKISGSGFLLLNRRQTKLTLVNQDGGLSLYDNRAQLVDRVRFSGSAPEGKSYARLSAQAWQFTKNPTPNSANQFLTEKLIDNTYPFGQSLNQLSSQSGFLILMLALGVILSLSAVFILKTNENLSQLFFGRD